MTSEDLKKQIIIAGRKAVEQLIKVAKEDIIKTDSLDDDLAADRLKNAAATKKLAIFDAFDILNKIDIEEENINLSNNTDSNKRDKLQEIIGSKNVKTLDTNHKLYDYFEKEDVREKMIRMFISRPDLLNQLRG